MCEVVDKTIGAGVPVPLRIWHGFQWSHGRKQFIPQGDRDEPVRLPDALSRADLGSLEHQFV